MCFLCLTFTIGCSLTDLTLTDAVRQCGDRGFANTVPISSGVVCYNRTTAGSEAVYICDEGFHVQDGAATRVCQSDGVWNSSIPQCLQDLGINDGSYNLRVCCCFCCYGHALWWDRTILCSMKIGKFVRSRNKGADGYLRMFSLLYHPYGII